MTFFGILRTLIIKAMPIFLAAIATALVILFFPLLSFWDKRPQEKTPASPVAVTISTIQVRTEAGVLTDTAKIARKKTSIAAPIELPSKPSVPPSTPELQAIQPLPDIQGRTLPAHEDRAQTQTQNPLAETEMQETHQSDASDSENIGTDNANENDSSAQKGNPPILLKKVEPYYPERSRRLGQEGYVIVQFEVDANGRVKNPTAHHAEPKGHFERAALNAIRQWRFQAAKDETGRPVAYRLQVRIDFRLHTK